MTCSFLSWCCWLTRLCRPIQHFSGLILCCSLSSHTDVVLVLFWRCRAHNDSSDEILKSGLSSPFTVLSMSNLKAKNGSKANLWFWWPWPLICEPLCLCLWNMAYFLHLIGQQMDNMVWQGLFRCLLFLEQSMMECNYQEWRMKPWGQRPFPVSILGMGRPRSLCPSPWLGLTRICGILSIAKRGVCYIF